MRPRTQIVAKRDRPPPHHRRDRPPPSRCQKDKIVDREEGSVCGWRMSFVASQMDGDFGSSPAVPQREWALRMSRYLLRSGEGSAYTFYVGREMVKLYIYLCDAQFEFIQREGMA